MLRDHIFIVFSKEHYNSLGIIRALGKYGIKPIYIAIKCKGPASRMSKYIETVHLVESKEEGYKLLLEKYGKCDDKPFLITSDDETQQMLDEHYSELIDKFYFFNAGMDGQIKKYMDKENVLSIAEEHGFAIPKTIVVSKDDKIDDDLNYPVITKSISPNVGGWKKDVFICNSKDELLKALDEILSPRILIQEFIDKENECCVEGISVENGKQIVIPMAIRYNYIIQGYYSPYMTAYPFKNKEAIDKIKALMKDIGYEGLFDVEFLVGKDGTLYFTEINFRNSIWDYIGVAEGISFPLVWAESVLSGKIDSKWEKGITKEYTAMVEPIDYGIRVKKGGLDLAKWLNDFKNTDIMFYHDQEDLAPFEEMVKHWEIYS